MKTVFDMTSGDRDWALSDPEPEIGHHDEQQYEYRNELALRLLTVEEALAMERCHRQVR